MPQPQRPINSRATRETDVESPHLALSSEALDEMETAVDAVMSGPLSPVDDWTGDTCEEFQKDPKFAEQCGSWTLGQCDAEYKEWVAVWKFPSMEWHPIFDVHAGGSAASSPRSSLKISRILIRSTARSTATP